MIENCSCRTKDVIVVENVFVGQRELIVFVIVSEYHQHDLNALLSVARDHEHVSSSRTRFSSG